MSEEPKININNQLENLRKLPAKKRLDAIINYENLKELVESMTAHDLLLTIDEVGGENALELLELMEPKQVQEVLDLDIWENDRLLPDKTGHFLSLLFEANADHAVEQLDGLDVELIGLLFKTVADIYDTTLNEEPEDYTNLVSKSPDGRFIVCFKENPKLAGLSHAMWRYLEMLYGVDMKRALGLLEKVRFELASGLEEASFKWRDGRLLDMGILPRDERLAYFATININDIKKASVNSKQEKQEEAISSPLVPYVHKLHGYPFLEAAISQCSPREAQDYLDSLVHAALNMHASLSGNFGNIEEIRHTVEYVKTLAEYGLAQATGGKPDQGIKILRANDMRSMIRLGRTALVNLRKLLRGALLDKSNLLGENFQWADSPLREMARVLMLSEPRFYEGLVDAKKLSVRFFSTLGELKATLNAVHELQFRAKVVGPEVLGCTEEMLKDHKELSHANIYARYLVNSFLKHKISLGEINAKDLKSIINNNTLNDEFLAYAKKYANTLGHKLFDHSSYNLNQALELTNNFSSAVLIQLEQNPELLLG